MTEFEKKLEMLINECSMENGSNTPDFLLAKYLVGCLTNYNATIMARESWYGRPAALTDHKPKMVPVPLYGDHMTLERFTKNCKCGSFTDDDGSGNYATATEMSDIEVSCSALAGGVEPALQDRKWTHVVWFNK